MTYRLPLVTAGLALLLWVVPSIGSQGMGTIGQRVPHADAALIDTVPANRPAARMLLRRADDAVEGALGL